MSKTVMRIGFVVYLELVSVNKKTINDVNTTTRENKNPILSKVGGYTFSVLVKKT